MNDILLYNKLSALPDKLKQAVFDFIETLIKKEKPLSKPKFGSTKECLKLRMALMICVKNSKTTCLHAVNPLLHFVPISHVLHSKVPLNVLKKS